MTYTYKVTVDGHCINKVVQFPLRLTHISTDAEIRKLAKAFDISPAGMRFREIHKDTLIK